MVSHASVGGHHITSVVSPVIAILSGRLSGVAHRRDDLLGETQGRLDVEGMAEVHHEDRHAQLALRAEAFEPLLGLGVGGGEVTGDGPAVGNGGRVAA